MNCKYTKLRKEEMENCIMPFIPVNRRGFPNRFDLGDIFRRVVHKLKTGCQWRFLFIDIKAVKLPFIWQTVYYYCRKWCSLGAHELFTACLWVQKDRLHLERLNLDGTHSLQEVASENGLDKIAITACSKGGYQAGFSYKTHYNVKSKTYYASKPEHSNKLAYSELMDAQKEYWEGTARQPYIPIVTSGWDKRPWEDSNTMGDWYYSNRTPEEFKGCLQDAIAWMDKYPDQATKERLLLIYAWNEYGERGYIAPTTGDPTGEYLRAIRSLVH